MANGRRSNSFVTVLFEVVLKVAAIGSVLAGIAVFASTFASPRRARNSKRESSLLRVSGGIFAVCGALLRYAAGDPLRRRNVLRHVFSLISSIPLQYVAGSVRNAYVSESARPSNGASAEVRSLLPSIRLKAALQELTLPFEELTLRHPHNGPVGVLSVASVEFLESWSAYLGTVRGAVTDDQAASLNRLAERLAECPAFSELVPPEEWRDVAALAAETLAVFGWASSPSSVDSPNPVSQRARTDSH